MLDELDEAAIERRRGRTSEGPAHRPGYPDVGVSVKPGSHQVAVLEGRSLDRALRLPPDRHEHGDRPGTSTWAGPEPSCRAMEAAFVDIGTP